VRLPAPLKHARDVGSRTRADQPHVNEPSGRHVLASMPQGAANRAGFHREAHP
jgi:hypothetical protein